MCMHMHIFMQAASLSAEAAESASLLRSQQHMILDQHARLRLQEQVVGELRAKLVAHAELVMRKRPAGACN